MRNTEKVEKMMCHKFRALSDRSSDHTDGFLDQNQGREDLLQRIRDIIGLSRIENGEEFGEIMSQKFSGYSDGFGD